MVASRPLVTLACLAALLFAGGPRAEAQTMKDKVKGHVDKNLDGKKRKGSGSGKNSGGRGGSSVRGGGDPATGGDAAAGGEQPAGETYDVSLADDPELVKEGPRLPYRLWPNGLKFDIMVDAAYRGWAPQQYNSAEVDIASFLTWSINVKMKPFSWMTLHRGYYESNALEAPRNSKASVAANAGKHIPKAAWVLAYLGFPFFKVWQPIIRYEARAFNTKATPNQPVCIVDREDTGDLMDCPLTTERLEMVSSFETFVVGVMHKSQIEATNVFATNDRKVPPFYAGVGLLQYRKPYQVTIGGDTLEEFLFDGRFRGAGLALGGNFGGGPKRFYADVDMQVGLGEVSLTDSFTLNEVTPDDWLIGYVQGNLNLGYKFVIIEGPPTVMLVPNLTGGGASFHFVSTSGDEDAGSPNVNWDFLWSARAAIEIAL